MANIGKTRQQREQELQRLANTEAGCNVILDLWKQIQGIPPGTDAPIGTLVRQEMIPAILDHEYPKG